MESKIDLIIYSVCLEVVHKKNSVSNFNQIQRILKATLDQFIWLKTRILRFVFMARSLFKNLSVRYFGNKFNNNNFNVSYSQKHKIITFSTSSTNFSILHMCKSVYMGCMFSNWLSKMYSNSHFRSQFYVGFSIGKHLCCVVTWLMWLKRRDERQEKVEERMDE